MIRFIRQRFCDHLWTNQEIEYGKRKQWCPVCNAVQARELTTEERETQTRYQRIALARYDLARMVAANRQRPETWAYIRNRAAQIKPRKPRIPWAWKAR